MIDSTDFSREKFVDNVQPILLIAFHDLQPLRVLVADETTPQGVPP